MLTGKQARFIDEYMVGLNGTQAAIRAGYSVKTARAIASENLRKPEIAAEIARRKEGLRQRSDGLALRVMAELARIGYSNIGAIMGSDGRIRPPNEWPQEAWDGIMFVTERGRFAAAGDSGKKLRGNYVRRIQPHEELRALALLGEYAGIFPPRTWARRSSKPKSRTAAD